MFIVWSAFLYFTKIRAKIIKSLTAEHIRIQLINVKSLTKTFRYDSF